MKKPVPKRKREFVDPAKAEELARETFNQRPDICNKPLEIVIDQEFMSSRKIIGIYGDKVVYQA